MRKVLPIRFLHPLGGGLVLRLLRDEVVRGDRRQNSFVWRQVRRLLKNVHWHGRSIELVHRRDSQQHLDSSNHADGIVKFVDQRSWLVVRADREADRTVRIDVVRAGLRIIFHDKNRRIFPIHARGNRLHQPAHRVIIVRNHELRRRKSILYSGGMIVGKSHDTKRGHLVRVARFALRYKSSKLGKPFA